MNAEGRERGRGVVIDDKEFEGKSVDEVRAAILEREARQELGAPGGGVCILLGRVGIRGLIDESFEDVYATIVDWKGWLGTGI